MYSLYTTENQEVNITLWAIAKIWGNYKVIKYSATRAERRNLIGTTL